ncbi:hypothetical protein C0J52_18513 [Blattella germanica]|nr:hypothetical protein C0J52_18513 [Blattella germanica]
MAWRVIRRMEAGQTQQEVAQAIAVSQCVISFSKNRYCSQKSRTRSTMGNNSNG